MNSETAKIGKRHTLVIPASIRRQYGLEEGALVILEARQEGILLRPVIALPMERYSSTRKAEFLLNNSVTMEDYEWAVKEVIMMGIDPETIPHEKP
ncbi:MAG: AbrB/MazE/SpoVT family DNA-binding domain-containing protein [Candidatus Desulfaltia sp.]|nr:AbrB/MazE/SpoVT family DNA-binding domain-containing protein [Candidatus Desulfaltia sp.]